MKIPEKSRERSILKSERAASPAVSTIILTATTIVLVLVAGNYATQILSQQEAASEFDTVQKSILVFDDAVRDIAWDRGGSRSVRFTTSYGDVRVFSSNKSFEIITSGFSEVINTAVVKYSISNKYFTIRNQYSSYILGDESPVVSSVTDSLGQSLVKQDTDFVSIDFNYRVHVFKEEPSTLVGSTSINYVNILVIRLNCNDFPISYGDFELIAKNVGISTKSYGPYSVDTGVVSVVSNGIQKSIQLDLEAEQVMFNLIIADVLVST
jgi:hypothetical protein